MISANLIGKCLLIGGAGAATGTGAYYIKETYFSNNKELKELAERVGLSCLGKPTETFGVKCTKKEGEGEKVKVKQGNTTIEATAISGGKIRVYLKSKNEEYNKDFKFVIEDGDISATTAAASGGSSTTKKLEQFETYEIKDENNDKNWKLIRKKKSWEEKRRMLGIPEETGCAFPEESSSSPVTCPLDTEKVKKINFKGKGGDIAVVDGTTGATINLKISKATADEATQFPLEYKFELQSNKEITLDSKANKSIKKDTNTEFKIKVTPASGGPKVLTLEKAWTVTALGEKVGLNCPEGGKNECTLNADKINVNNGSNKKYTGLTKGTNGDDKKVKYEEDVGDHNQGIKFFVDEKADIELQNGTGGTGSGDEKKILKKDGTSGSETSYEIKKDTDNNWYLTKKTTSPSPAA